MAGTTPLTLGALRVYFLDGGGFRLDGGALFGPVPRSRWMTAYPAADDNTVPLTAHAMLVQSGGTWGLVDCGLGHHLSERQQHFYGVERESRLEVGLAELGVSRTSIDWIVLSHLHLDHAGGLPSFPNALVWLQRLELDEAHDVTNRAHGVYATDMVDHLLAEQRLRVVDGEAEAAPGVRVFLTGGHSRGHQATLLGDDLLHLGDVLATRAHLSPAWVSALDDFPLDTIRAKRHWLPLAVAHTWWVAFSHDVSVAAGRLDDGGRTAQTWSA